MCWPRVGAANLLFSLWRAFWRPTATASRKKSRRTTEESRTITTFEDDSDCYQNAGNVARDVPGTLTTLCAPFVSTSNSLWPNTTQVYPIPVIKPQIAWLQDKHENLFTRRKAYPEGSARRKLWFSKVNKSACVRTLPYYKCFIILNQQRTEKKSFFIQINFANAVHLMTSQT